jgi:hypothetical protein
MLVAAVAGTGVIHLASWMVHDKLVAGELVDLFPDAKAMPDRQAASTGLVRDSGARMRPAIAVG